MARLLEHRTRVRLVLLAGSLGSLMLFASGTLAFHQGNHYQSTLTSYAYGNLSGGGGTILQTDFANHYSVWCPGDPAAYWSFGTTIVHDSAIIYHDQNGWPYQWSSSVLKDVGDPTCGEANYWADIYQGRYKTATPTNPCSCPGVPTTNNCGYAPVDSCSEASAFGRQYRGYTK